MSLTLNNIVIESRPVDKYINATQMCKAGGKEMNHWLSLVSTKRLIETLKETLKDEADSRKDSDPGISLSLIDVKRGGDSKLLNHGSWIHPDLAVLLAQWISPMFAIKVSRWVNRWRRISASNEIEFLEALSSITPSKSTALEKYYNDKYKDLLMAESEVETPVGRIDLLTSNKIIEIKTASNWKNAIGQILCYGVFFPSHERWLYLFSHEELRGDIKEYMKTICLNHEIKIKYI